MEILFLLVGLVIGIAVGYLVAERKNSALKAELMLSLIHI